MGIEDNEVFDRAFDAAEAKLAASQEEVIQESSPSDDVAPSEDIQETVALKTAVDKQSPTPKKDRARGEGGKFAKAAEPKPVSDHVANEANVEAVQEDAPETESAPPIDVPQFWPDDLKAAAAEVPKALLERFVKHDTQREEWARRTATEAERGKAIEKRLYEGFEPRRIEALKNGVKDPLAELDRYRDWDEIFKSDPKAALADLMAKNGLTPHDFFEDQNQQAQYPQDQYVQQALAEAREAKRIAEEWKTQVEEQKKQQETTQLQSVVKSFKEGKDSTGNVRKPFAEMYAPQIDEAAQHFRNAKPDMPLSDVLNHAYEFVLGEVRKVHGMTATQAKPQEQAIAQAKKASAAAGSVRGAPATGVAASRPRAKTVDEAYDRAEEALGFR